MDESEKLSGHFNGESSGTEEDDQEKDETVDFDMEAYHSIK